MFFLIESEREHLMHWPGKHYNYRSEDREREIGREREREREHLINWPGEHYNDLSELILFHFPEHNCTYRVSLNPNHMRHPVTMIYYDICDHDILPVDRGYEVDITRSHKHRNRIDPCSLLRKLNSILNLY